MTTMPMGPRRQPGSTGERRETADPRSRAGAAGLRGRSVRSQGATWVSGSPSVREI